MAMKIKQEIIEEEVAEVPRVSVKQEVVEDGGFWMAHGEGATVPNHVEHNNWNQNLTQHTPTNLLIPKKESSCPNLIAVLSGKAPREPRTKTSPVFKSPKPYTRKQPKNKSETRISEEQIMIHIRNVYEMEFHNFMFYAYRSFYGYQQHIPFPLPPNVHPSWL
ncbi:hypothetical protein L5515_008790 [Caenorhabditis briggsae]|uniref:Uncharacterized protein n=1 Tax=Caenorhabditis briggsae TaxID=6238 RepID=A0AAE9F787_CAEBR|nr:hypothetical protein L5515_008790 [Caenorhabditis briggsae]